MVRLWWMGYLQCSHVGPNVKNTWTRSGQTMHSCFFLQFLRTSKNWIVKLRSVCSLSPEKIETSGITLFFSVWQKNKDRSEVNFPKSLFPQTLILLVWGVWGDKWPPRYCYEHCVSISVVFTWRRFAPLWCVSIKKKKKRRSHCKMYSSYFLL